jgi:prolyl 3-hydroxylase /prolyl 3,4-dihydroxylase
LDWLEHLSGIKGLYSNIDLFGAIYSDGSYLQCHDDKLEGRRIAFIYYMVSDDWSEKQGGMLEKQKMRVFVSNDRCVLGQLSLFEVEANGIPKAEPFKKIVPKRNSLLIFNVSVNSFHRVEELLTDEGRLTLTGWFHGPPIPYPPVIDTPTLPIRPLA